MKEKLHKLMKKASVLEVTDDKVRMRQFLDRWGVCFIPVKQDEAARRLLALLGRKVTGVTGSKRGDLYYEFEPPLTEEEYDDFFG